MTDIVYSVVNQLLKFPPAKKYIWTCWYRFCAKKFPLDIFKYINFGFAPDNHEPLLDLSKEDEDNRYFIQLYHHLISKVDVRHKNILEVGCGRGGGTHFISQYTACHEVLGLDRCKESIDLANHWFHRDNLDFQVGDAHHLPVHESHYDVVINVESSHCYENMSLFLKEVKRVLRPNGSLLLADFRDKKELELLQNQIDESPLTQVEEQDITQYVLNSLKLDDNRKRQLITAKAPKYLHWLCLDLAACVNSRVYKALANGTLIYKFFHLKA